MNRRANRGRLRGWGLARRIVTREPGQALIIAILTALATWMVLATSERADDEIARLESRATSRYGSVTIGVAGGVVPSIVTPEFPLLSAINGAGRGLWLTRGLVDELDAVARELDLRTHVRVAGAASSSDERVNRLVAIGNGDPARTLDLRPPAGDTYTVAILHAEDEPVLWREIADGAIVGISQEGVVFVDLGWMIDAMRPRDLTPVSASIAGNEVIVHAPDANPFSLAFDLREISGELASRLTFQAWPELVGLERYVGAGGSATLLRPLVLLVAIAGVTGAAAVATRNRVRDIVLLRTIGMDLGAVRGVYVREIALGSVVAALVVAAVVWLVPDMSFNASARRTLLAAAVLPPLVGFLTIRRQLRAPLGRIRREAEL